MKKEKVNKAIDKAGTKAFEDAKDLFEKFDVKDDAFFIYAMAVDGCGCSTSLHGTVAMVFDGIMHIIKDFAEQSDISVEDVLFNLMMYSKFRFEYEEDDDE